MITADELKRIYLAGRDRVDNFIEPFNETLHEFDILTALRVAAFVAQVGHESGEFRYVHEIASGQAYEGRRDLGNTEPGDGVRFKGRGLIQITGRSNYAKCGEFLGLDLLASPELLETPENACRSAGWFWETHGLNDLADKQDMVLMTKRINGGLNGFDSRKAYYERALNVLGE